MSKITNDGLTRSGMRYSCTHMATVGVKGLSRKMQCKNHRCKKTAKNVKKIVEK